MSSTVLHVIHTPLDTPGRSRRDRARRDVGDFEFGCVLLGSLEPWDLAATHGKFRKLICSSATHSKLFSFEDQPQIVFEFAVLPAER